MHSSNGVGEMERKMVLMILSNIMEGFSLNHEADAYLGFLKKQSDINCLDGTDFAFLM